MISLIIRLVSNSILGKSVALIGFSLFVLYLVHGEYFFHVLSPGFKVISANSDLSEKIRLLGSSYLFLGTFYVCFPYFYLKDFFQFFLILLIPNLIFSFVTFLFSAFVFVGLTKVLGIRFKGNDVVTEIILNSYILIFYKLAFSKISKSLERDTSESE